MRVWDIPVEKLCNKHLLGQHREIHAIYSMITENKGGSYQKHPEVIRWNGFTLALYNAHLATVAEMLHRGMNHNSHLDKMRAACDMMQGQYNRVQSQWQTTEQQIEILRKKNCDCKV